MAWRMLWKWRFGSVVAIILIVNLIWLASLSTQTAFPWRNHQTSVYLNVDQQKARQNYSTSTTLSPAMKMKVEEINKELNTSLFVDALVYPGKAIGRYLMVYPKLCQGVDHVDIVIIVHTAPSHLDKRQRMRDSFAQESLYYPFQVRIAFLLGKTDNKTLERVLWMEHVRYNDTVMGDFQDHYHNLSLKGVLGYRWISEHCSNARFVLKIDDDVLINMFKLLYSFLSHMNPKKKSIFCNLWHRDTMPILRVGKWKVDNRLFSRRKTFPYDYCSGFVVLMTSDLIKPMYEASLSTPFFWIDDVYLFGMLPSVVGGVTYYNYALDKNVTLNDKVAMNCTKTQGPRCPIFATYISNNAYWTYWDMIKGLYISTTWNVENKIVQ